jgi:hypothetical protein
MRYNFENTFRTVVKDLGGELVPEVNNVENADYFFPQDSVVIELKTLEEEARQEHGKALQKLVDDWIRRGLWLGYGRVNISLPDMRPECQAEWLPLLLAPVENVVKKANRQIRATKLAKDCPDARGLLVVANDGNLLHTSPKDYMNLVARVLSKKTQDRKPRFPHIHGVVYFSYRIGSREEGLPFWVAGYTQKGGDPAMSAFQERLQHGWFSYVSKMTGLPVTVMAAR